MARVKSSEEDVYYRNDPMKSVAQGQLVSLVISLGEERKGTEARNVGRGGGALTKST